MPRGVPNPNIRQDLRAAALRLLLTRGPASLTGRAITREAGCATGALYNHFANVNDLLADLVVETLSGQEEQMRGLIARAGSGTVKENLIAAAAQLADEKALAMAAVSAARPEVADLVRNSPAVRAPAFPGLAGSIREYLLAEQRLGRVSATTNPDVAATVLIASLHHIMLRATDQSREAVRRDLTHVVDLVVDGVHA